ncbi:MULTISPECIES: hypothetical protein [Kitasatospora]|uniref:Uncharacterized protein n=1 Tax=Kitasatospora setae (strain ATCC 33774 / DSM 43861 / JCM 3304 / KCC A-0304 / NBRC 14216 / KM-6054) TaxID=452652 RepID=E4N674_KITSK|nr:MULTISPECIES: hypothetical protein [Kitasatospora]BAJ26705.1 hypothetical protein KSE_08680 [Kitasatospora setae KM-6054]
MRRRTLLGIGLAGAVGVAVGPRVLGAALAVALPSDSGVGERVADERQFEETGSSYVSSGVRTETDPMARLFDRFGPIEQAHWVLEGPGPAHRPLRAGDAAVYALLRLPAGAVAGLLLGRPTEPAGPLPARDHDRPVADDRAPHALAALAPAGAAWETAPGYPRTANAESASVRFDRATDTLYARAIRPQVPIG